MNTYTHNYLQLPVAERIQLVEEIWDSIVQESPESIQLTEEQKAELDKRWSAHLADPEGALAWSDVRKKLHNRFIS